MDNSYVAKKLEAQRYWHLKVNPLDLEQVKAYAKKFGYNEDYYIVCDFGKRSGLKRFYVYDLENGERIMESYCMHGSTNSNARPRGILIHSSWKPFRFHGQI